jgi:putative hemolysin
MELLIIFLLIVLNGIFSMSEIAIVSSRKSRLEQAAKDGSRGARAALKLAGDPNTFLSTVQIGITLIGIVTGVFGGASIAALLEPWLQKIAVLAPYSQTIALSVVVLLITFLSLVIGELVPKRIGMNAPERIAILMAGPMSLLSRIAAPFVWLLSRSTELILRLFRLKSAGEAPVTEAEIRTMIGHGTRSGVFEEIEQDIVERVFNLSDRKVGSLMTNRRELPWLDLDDSLLTNLQVIASADADVFLVGKQTMDQIQGMIRSKKVLTELINGKLARLEDVMEKPLVVHEHMDAFRVLELLQESSQPAAIVIDEFGTVQGMVSLRNLFRAIMGDVEAEPEQGGWVVSRSDGSSLVDALMPLDEFVHYFEIETIDDEDRVGFHTVGGLIFDLAGRIPRIGDSFHWYGYRLEVVDMDGNRVDQLLVSPRKANT